MRRTYLHRGLGFSLVELMITVAIIGILAAIAYPSYQEQIAKSRRNEATNALFSSAQALERFYSANGRYTAASGGTTLPAVFVTKVPDNGATYYTIAATAAANNTFTLKATRSGVMLGDACGNFSLDETGQLALLDKPSGSSKTVADCWRR
ncbi:MAG: type IV pilin protein [Zhongshania sp.]|uniref:type IV pilin protein n=1 Tax=Zhongshania sp. TaxID=1971902 RepID=UPI00262C1EC9|nr:type IV pilin protein [Zhongshania sp.]MDF1691178.1 type IV pilin protein [Zhongshania sp.]